MQIVPEYMFYLTHIFRYTDRIKQGFLDILRSAGLAFWSKEVQKIKQKLLCPRKLEVRIINVTVKYSLRLKLVPNNQGRDLGGMKEHSPTLLRFSFFVFQKKINYFPPRWCSNDFKNGAF